MTGKKWVGLDEPMGSDCKCCIHQDECAPLKRHVSFLNEHFQFRCPIIVEVDENIEYSKSKRKG